MKCPDFPGTVLALNLCRISHLLALTVIWTASYTVFAQERTIPNYIPETVFVQFETGIALTKNAITTGLQEFDRKAAHYKIYRIERAFPFLDHIVSTPKIHRNLIALRRTYLVRYHANVPPKLVADDLNHISGVAYSEPAMKYHMHSSVVEPNDPEFSNQEGVRQLRLPEAWDIVRSEGSNPKIVIAIVDSGSEWDHEDLAANVWVNEDEIPDNGIDDDQNGFVDDVNGVNFSSPDSNNPKSRWGEEHGTLVSGAAGAVSNNGLGISGTAWNADLMHVNIACSPEFGSGICHGEQGIAYAAANEADIINTSWGGRSPLSAYSTLLEQTLELATDMGSLVVVASGNESKSLDHFRFMPASHPRVLSVGSTQAVTRTLAHFSNYGTLVNVYAPGMQLLTTGLNNGYQYVEGTSFSSPLVAGVAALVKTKYPDWTPDMVREHIRLTSENMDKDNPNLSGELGRGFVNALAAVQTPPSMPAIRLKRWSWIDDDGNREISPGDAVTITAVLVNYLSNTSQLNVELVQEDTYPFLNWETHEKDVGVIARDDSVKIKFDFNVAKDLDETHIVRLFTHIQDGEFEDRTDILVLTINPQYKILHENLIALYQATGGDSWVNKENWNLDKVPSVPELTTWYGVALMEGGIFAGLALQGNNLTGYLPPEIGNFSSMDFLYMDENQISGEIPPEIKKLTNLQELDVSNNLLSGEIPSELGDLSSIKYLNLNNNKLSGAIPPELGNISELVYLSLRNNSLSGEVPPELGNLSKLEFLFMEKNQLTGELPRSLLQLDHLVELHFDGQPLCAPADDEFQAWLNSIPFVGGTTCSAVSFTIQIKNQSYTRTKPITPLVLPIASGAPPIIYTLSPSLPRGLAFDPKTRIIRGTPTQVQPPTFFTYTATDADSASASLKFSIEVVSPVSESLPDELIVHANYPNPFRQTTRMVFDLPRPARIHIEVMDILGRHVYTNPPVDLEAGWGQEVELNSIGLPAGHYLYRLTADMTKTQSVYVGQFVRTQ